MIARCNLCADDDGQAFRVPWDEIGAALMQAHMKEQHGEETATR